MSSKVTKATAASEKQPVAAAKRIPYPILLLSIVVCLVYAGSMTFNFTELDDTIFILENESYNSQLSNLTHSFTRGVFSETEDTYYRPVLLDSYILNHTFAGSDIRYYHLVNLLLHWIAVCLLYLLLLKLLRKPRVAFILALLFAVHPVLSQAVAWIPGRNDTLMAVFGFAFMWLCIRFMEQGSWRDLLLQFLCWLLLLFTKESALFFAPGFMHLVITFTELNWKSKKNGLVYASWVLGLLIWFALRAMATVKNDPIQFTTLLAQVPLRFTLSIQYLGKIFFPFQLSVFPMLRETSYLWGLLTLLLLGGLIYVAKKDDRKRIWAGLGWFLLFLLPLFLLPSALNDQDFEHRLYVPVLGILLCVSQAPWFKEEIQGRVMGIVLGIGVLFTGLNLYHQQSFKDNISFWQAAVASTPHSAYANMMLGARVYPTDTIKGRTLFQEAYRLNPKEKYINYYLGRDYLDQMHVDSARKYLLDELQISKYFDTYFLLSRVEFMRHDSMQSLHYMEAFLEKDHSNPQAINNYILLLAQTRQFGKAATFIQTMEAKQVLIPSELKRIIHDSLAMRNVQ